MGSLLDCTQRGLLRDGWRSNREARATIVSCGAQGARAVRFLSAAEAAARVRTQVGGVRTPVCATSHTTASAYACESAVCSIRARPWRAARAQDKPRNRDASH